MRGAKHKSPIINTLTTNTYNFPGLTNSQMFKWLGGEGFSLLTELTTQGQTYASEFVNRSFVTSGQATGYFYDINYSTKKLVTSVVKEYNILNTTNAACLVYVYICDPRNDIIAQTYVASTTTVVNGTYTTDFDAFTTVANKDLSSSGYNATLNNNAKPDQYLDYTNGLSVTPYMSSTFTSLWSIKSVKRFMLQPGHRIKFTVVQKPWVFDMAKITALLKLGDYPTQMYMRKWSRSVLLRFSGSLGDDTPGTDFSVPVNVGFTRPSLDVSCNTKVKTQFFVQEKKTLNMMTPETSITSHDRLGNLTKYDTSTNVSIKVPVTEVVQTTTGTNVSDGT